jgi:hypothetical protein
MLLTADTLAPGKKREAIVEKWLAIVEFEFENDSPDTVGARLRTLGRVARDAGFELKRGKVEPLPQGEDGCDDVSGWMRYAP